MMPKSKNSCFQARQEVDQCWSIVQPVLQESTGFLRWIIAPVQGQGGVTLSYVCLRCHRFPLEHYIWWVSRKDGRGQELGETNIQHVVRGMRWPEQPEVPHRVSLVQDGADPNDAKVFRAHVRSRTSCMRSTCWPTCMLWGKSGENLADLIFEGLQEHRRLTTGDAVKIDDLKRNTDVRKVVLPSRRECFVLSSTVPVWGQLMRIHCW